jgi:hypothetical protein
LFPSATWEQVKKMDNQIQNLIDIICLVYHEARNVRHPIKAGKLPKDQKYYKLLNLPHNRDDAWLQMAGVREKAAHCQTARDAAQVFQNEYGLGLEELFALYREPCWKGSLYGGNKWAPICSKLISLLEAIESGDARKGSQFLKEIIKMEHNTGTVEQKLKKLKKE